jgi:hypothetical protein
MTVSSAESSMRVWIVATALACVITGAFVGYSIPGFMATAQMASMPEVYAKDLVSKYGLSVEQELSLLKVLEEDRRVETNILRDADWSQLPRPLRAKRLAAKRKTEQRIRFVLDERQRALYDRDSRPISPGAKATSGSKK